VRERGGGSLRPNIGGRTFFSIRIVTRKTLQGGKGDTAQSVVFRMTGKFAEKASRNYQLRSEERCRHRKRKKEGMTGALCSFGANIAAGSKKGRGGARRATLGGERGIMKTVIEATVSWGRRKG